MLNLTAVSVLYKQASKSRLLTIFLNCRWLRQSSRCAAHPTPIFHSSSAISGGTKLQVSAAICGPRISCWLNTSIKALSSRLSFSFPRNAIQWIRQGFLVERVAAAMRGRAGPIDRESGPKRPNQRPYRESCPWTVRPPIRPAAGYAARRRQILTCSPKNQP